MDEPYANDPAHAGSSNGTARGLAEVIECAVSRGWRIATHAVGYRAVRIVLEVYGQTVERHPRLTPGTLAIEHAFLAGPAERARAAHLGVAVTVQHPLLYAHGAEMLRRWGPERTAAVMPLRSWLADGAMVSAGTGTVRQRHDTITRDGVGQGRSTLI